MDWICRFNKLNPPKFQGGTDPLKYEEWRRKLENLFDIMECPEQYKVALTTYQFEGEVEYWWGTVKPRRGEEPMTWERLMELLDAKYYPLDIQRLKEREFLSLKQGDASVMEYAAQFNELSRFAPHQVSTEERRMDHFEQGLRGDIKSVIAAQTFANFQDMYQKAVKVAHVIEEDRRETQALTLGGRKREFPRSNVPTQSERRVRPSFLPEKGKQPMYSPRYPVCRNCGKRHEGKCLFGSGSCYECGQWGHRRSECPKLVGSQQRIMPPAAPPTKPPRPLAVAPRPPLVAPRPPFCCISREVTNGRYSSTS